MATPQGEYSMMSVNDSQTTENVDETSVDDTADNQAGEDSTAIGVDTDAETVSQTPFKDMDFSIQGILEDVDINTFLLVVLIIIKIGEMKS